MVKGKYKYLILFAGILVLAGVLRFYKLSEMPPSLNWDEISHGYNAWSLLKTGSDEWGQRFPIANFRAYGDYPLPLNLYLTIPFEAVFGLSAFAIRFPHMILGVLTVVAVYFFVWGLLKKKEMALMAAFLAAVNPWYLFTSRFVLQSNLSVFFLVAAAALFVKRESNKWFLPLSIVSFGLTLFSYHSTRIFSPLLLVAVIVIYRKAIFSKINLVLVLLFFLPLSVILLSPQARARSNEVFLLNPSVVYSIEVARNGSGLPDTLKRVVYNRPVYITTRFARNYLEYFSPQYLFVKGGTQYQFSLPNHGVLYAAELPFFYIGLLYLLKKSRKEKNFRFILFWLLLSPIPASITTEQFAVVRSTTMLPMTELLVVLGLFVVASYLLRTFKVNKNYFFVIFILTILISLIEYLGVYFGSYKTDYSWAWQYGNEGMTKFVSANYGKYDKIIITKKYGEPHEYMLFYLQWDPSKYKNDLNLNRFYQSNWYWVDGFDKFIFVNDWDIPTEGKVFVTESKKQIDCTKIKCLIVTGPGNYPRNWGKLKTINFLDGKTAFELYEN